MAVFVLDQMKVLDQKVAAARAVGQQRLDIRDRLGIELAALRGSRRAAPAGTPRLSGGSVCGGSVRLIHYLLEWKTLFRTELKRWKR